MKGEAGMELRLVVAIIRTHALESVEKIYSVSTKGEDAPNRIRS